MKYEDIYKYQLEKHYCSAKELQYSVKHNICLTPFELKGFYDYKDSLEDGSFSNSHIKLDLKTFNSKGIYFSKCIELSTYIVSLIDLMRNDLSKSDKPLAIRNMPEILKSRIYSEIEGSLNIENVNTTRKAFNDLVIKDLSPKTENEIIIKNMAKGIEYVSTLPSFNKENLYKLYNILSKDSLDDNHKLKEKEYYRYDGVEVAEYKGCPVHLIDECMESLFKFVNDNLTNVSMMFLLPHIAHYYILYIHPYFDFNGRTARMVSLWIHLLININTYPPFISDAINTNKNKYYEVIEETRNSHNDITYFLNYIFNISISYFLTYLNIENIDKALLNKGTSLSNLEKDYIKKILICSNNNNFSYLDFIKWNHIDISKQGAFKILNKFVEYGILKEVDSKSNKKLFALNNSIIEYKINL